MASLATVDDACASNHTLTQPDRLGVYIEGVAAAPNPIIFVVAPEVNPVVPAGITLAPVPPAPVGPVAPVDPVGPVGPV